MVRTLTYHGYSKEREKEKSFGLEFFGEIVQFSSSNIWKRPAVNGGNVTLQIDFLVKKILQSVQQGLRRRLRHHQGQIL